jgi:hypothetical protein
MEEVPLEAIEQKLSVVYISNNTNTKNISNLKRIGRVLYPLYDVKAYLLDMLEDKDKKEAKKHHIQKLGEINTKLGLPYTFRDEYESDNKGLKGVIAHRDELLSIIEKDDDTSVQDSLEDMSKWASLYIQEGHNTTAYRVYRIFEENDYKIYVEDIDKGKLMLVMKRIDNTRAKEIITEWTS